MRLSESDGGLYCLCLLCHHHGNTQGMNLVDSQMLITSHLSTRSHQRYQCLDQVQYVNWHMCTVQENINGETMMGELLDELH